MLDYPVPIYLLLGNGLERESEGDTAITPTIRPFSNTRQITPVKKGPMITA